MENTVGTHLQVSIEQWNKDVPYRQRQVYAAIAKVDASLCTVCPYFRPIKNPDAGQQPGICCYCREESTLYGMSGKPGCTSS